MLKGRLELFRSSVGSVNYNLNDKNSDKDYKIFCNPSFDDIYYRKIFSKSVNIDNKDFSIHDIRHLADLLFNSNVNFLECLFAKEIYINKKELDDTTIQLVNRIFQYKNEIACINLPYLYSSTKGMYMNKIKLISKGTKNTKYLIDLYGYDTKSALSAYRILDFANRFAQSNFKDFKHAIVYNDDERERLLYIKKGKYSINEINDIINNKYLNEFLKLEELYKSQNINVKLKDFINKICKDIIRHYFTKKPL